MAAKHCISKDCSIQGLPFAQRSRGQIRLSDIELPYNVKPINGGPNEGPVKVIGTCAIRAHNLLEMLMTDDFLLLKILTIYKR